MTYTFDGFNYTIRLQKDERFSQAMRTFAKQSGVISGWFSGIGGAESIEIAYYNLKDKAYKTHRPAGLHEVVSLTGNIAAGPDSSLMCHTHGVFANAGFQTVGGHVIDFVVGATLEVFVHVSQKSLQRYMDSEVGLPLLQLEKGNDQ